MKLFNFRPIVFSALYLAAGIFCALITTVISFWAIVIPFVLTAAIFVFVCLYYKNVRYAFYAVSFVFIFFIGFALFFGKVNFSNQNVDRNYTSVSFEGEVKTISTANNGNYHVVIKNVTSDDLDFHGTCLSVYTKNPDISRGDRVKGTADLKKTPLSIDNLYFLEKEIVFSADGNVGLTLVKKSENIGDFVAGRVVDAVLTFAGEREGSLMIAMLLGRTEFIPDELHDEFKMAGVAHIFAVSGLHIGFFFAVFSFLFDKMGVKRWRNVILVTLLSLLYALICSSVSAYRAVIMCFTYGMVRSFGKKYDPLNSIFLSMLIVLCVFPSSLFGAGFLLSYSAVASLALFSLPIKNRLKFLPTAFAENFAASLAVTLGTLPVIIVFYGFSSVLGIFINAIFLPLVSFIYVLSFVGGVIATIFYHSNFILSFAALICRLINDVMVMVDFERFLLVFHNDEILIAIYSVILLMTTDKVNISEKLRNKFFILLPFAVLTML